MLFDEQLHRRRERLNQLIVVDDFGGRHVENGQILDHVQDGTATSRRLMLIEHVQCVGESNIGNVEIRRQTEEEKSEFDARSMSRYAPEEHRNAKGAEREQTVVFTLRWEIDGTGERCWYWL